MFLLVLKFNKIYKYAPVYLSGAIAESVFEFSDDGRIGCHGDGQLLSLDVLEMFHCHFQDVCFFEFGVTGGLK